MVVSEEQERPGAVTQTVPQAPTQVHFRAVIMMRHHNDGPVPAWIVGRIFVYAAPRHLMAGALKKRAHVVNDLRLRAADQNLRAQCGHDRPRSSGKTLTGLSRRSQDELAFAIDEVNEHAQAAQVLAVEVEVETWQVR